MKRQPKTWFTADPHFGDKRSGKMNNANLFDRPFDHDGFAEEFVRNWNTLVQPEDTVYVNGDFCVDEESLEWADKLVGTKHLLRGNYEKLSDKVYLQYFESINDHVILGVTNPGTDTHDPHAGEHLHLLIQHYPARAKAGYLNLTGHIHGAWKLQKNMINVGVDVWNYRPIDLDTVFFTLKCIRYHYDQDVWVENHISNIAYHGRGKKTHYWDKDVVVPALEVKEI